MSLKTRIKKLEQNQPSSDVRIVKYFDGSTPKDIDVHYIGRITGMPTVTLIKKRFGE